MRTETIVRNIYQFDELSDSAKERARDWYREGADYSWADENRQSLDAFCNAFPVEARDWAYDAWAYNISFRFTGDDETGELSGNRLRTYLLNNYSQVLYAPKVYRKGAWHKGCKERKSRIIRVQNDCPLTGYCMDESLLDNIRGFIAKPDSRTFVELLDDCLTAWAKACRDDCEYQNSDECVDETIRANEYEFLENGERA